MNSRKPSSNTGPTEESRGTSNLDVILYIWLFCLVIFIKSCRFVGQFMFVVQHIYIELLQHYYVCLFTKLKWCEFRVQNGNSQICLNRFVAECSVYVYKKAGGM